MSRTRRLYSSLGIGELLTAKAEGLLLLGALVATAAVLYGNAYASHGHVEEEEAEHAEEEGEGGEAAEGGEEHAEEEEADEGSRSLKITESILISTAGAGLVPLGLLLARRRTRSADELAPQREPEAPAAGPPEPKREAGFEPVLRPALALLSVGAAVIHFVVVPGHWDEYWGQGLFFIVAAIAQLQQRQAAPTRTGPHPASTQSLQRRLETALTRNSQLRRQVDDLTRRLEAAHGELRRLRALSNPTQR